MVLCPEEVPDKRYAGSECDSLICSETHGSRRPQSRSPWQNLLSFVAPAIMWSIYLQWSLGRIWGWTSCASLFSANYWNVHQCLSFLSLQQALPVNWVMTKATLAARSIGLWQYKSNSNKEQSMFSSRHSDASVWLKATQALLNVVVVCFIHAATFTLLLCCWR